MFPFHKLKLLAFGKDFYREREREREKEKREGGRGGFWSFTRVLFTLEVEVPFFSCS